MKVLVDGVVVLVPRFGLEGSILFTLTEDSGRVRKLQEHDANTTPSGYKYDIRSIEYIAKEHRMLVFRSQPTQPYALQVFDKVQVTLQTVELSSGSRQLQMDLVVPKYAKVFLFEYSMTLPITNCKQIE